MSSSWRCSTLVRNLTLELRSKAEVETGWIKKVKELAEATMGKCTEGKEGQYTKFSQCFWKLKEEVNRFPQPE